MTLSHKIIIIKRAGRHSGCHHQGVKQLQQDSLPLLSYYDAITFKFLLDINWVSIHLLIYLSIYNPQFASPVRLNLRSWKPGLKTETTLSTASVVLESDCNHLSPFLRCHFLTHNNSHHNGDTRLDLSASSVLSVLHLLHSKQGQKVKVGGTTLPHLLPIG